MDLHVIGISDRLHENMLFMLMLNDEMVRSRGWHPFVSFCLRTCLQEYTVVVRCFSPRKSHIVSRPYSRIVCHCLSKKIQESRMARYNRRRICVRCGLPWFQAWYCSCELGVSICHDYHGLVAVCSLWQLTKYVQ